MFKDVWKKAPVVVLIGMLAVVFVPSNVAACTQTDVGCASVDFVRSPAVNLSKCGVPSDSAWIPELVAELLEGKYCYEMYASGGITTFGVSGVGVLLGNAGGDSCNTDVSAMDSCPLSSTSYQMRAPASNCNTNTVTLYIAGIPWDADTQSSDCR